jgi:hypothetical protein
VCKTIIQLKISNKTYFLGNAIVLYINSGKFLRHRIKSNTGEFDLNEQQCEY